MLNYISVTKYFDTMLTRIIAGSFLNTSIPILANQTLCKHLTVEKYIFIFKVTSY